MATKGIVFDLDGTLVDTAIDLKNALNYTLEQRNFPIATLEQTKEWIGNGMWNLIRRALPDDKKNDDNLVDELVEILNTYYTEHCIDESQAYKFTEEVLKEIKNKGIKISVISNKPNKMVHQILDKVFPDITFDYVSGHKEGFNHKPDPGLLLFALEEQGLKPREVILIGDSLTDLKTANNAEIEPILVRNGYENQKLIEETEAKKINNFKEILKFI